MLKKVMQFSIKTKKRQEIFNITSKVKEIVKKSKVKEGFCCIYVPHATCSVIINENCDSAVCEDIISALNKIVPEHSGWKHDKIDNNAAAHIKSSLIGPSQIVPINAGELQLGRWQGIALAEFDGPRERTVLVEIK